MLNILKIFFSVCMKEQKFYHLNQEIISKTIIDWLHFEKVSPHNTIWRIIKDLELRNKTKNYEVPWDSISWKYRNFSFLWSFNDFIPFHSSYRNWFGWYYSIMQYFNVSLFPESWKISFESSKICLELFYYTIFTWNMIL